MPKSTPIIVSAPKKQLYLKNKNLMIEIHKSKTSFSSYTSKEYADYDLIINNFDQLTREALDEARLNRAKRLATQELERLHPNTQKKIKLAEVQEAAKDIPNTDLVFRLVTYEHITQNLQRKKTKKVTSDWYEKLNFIPFQHWKFDEKSDLYCVGKSHWKGSLEDGEFSIDHGKITETLGRFFITLCERYGQRNNWRGYTYLEEMKGQALLQLIQVGLKFDEAQSDNPFSYYTMIMENSFRRILNVEKRVQNIRDDILEDSGLTPSSTRQYANSFPEDTKRQADLYKHKKKTKVTTTETD